MIKNSRHKKLARKITNFVVNYVAKLLVVICKKTGCLEEIKSSQFSSTLYF